MNVLMVRAKIKKENVADAQAAIEKVIQALEQTQPAGVRYASCLLSDGVTFVALVELGGEVAKLLIPGHYDATGQVANGGVASGVAVKDGTQVGARRELGVFR